MSMHTFRLASPSGVGSWSGSYLPHVQIAVLLSTGLLTSYGRAIPRWWKKRVSWSRGKRHGHPDNHLWKQGEKKEGKIEKPLPLHTLVLSLFASKLYPKLYCLPLPNRSGTHYPFHVTQATVNIPSLSQMLPKLVIVFKWFRLIRCRFEYKL